MLVDPVLVTLITLAYLKVLGIPLLKKTHLNLGKMGLQALNTIRFLTTFKLKTGSRDRNILL